MFIEAADQVEQQLPAGLSEGKISEVIEHDVVFAGQEIGNSAIAALGLIPLDEIDDVVEAAAGPAADAATSDSDGEMRLAVPVPPASTTLRCCAMKPPLARSRTSASLFGVPLNSDPVRSLASGSLAMVSRYLIERPPFS